MTSKQGETAQEMGLMLRADDGVTYVIPQSVVEAHRLSDEQRTELEAQLAADGADVEGFYYGPSGNVGSFEMTRPQVSRQSIPFFGTWTSVQMVPYQGWGGKNPYPNGYPGLR